MAALISPLSLSLSLSLSLFFILYVINFIRKKWSQVHREYSSWTSVILSLIWYARVFGFMYFHMLFNSPCTLPVYYGCVVLIYLNKFDFYWLKKKALLKPLPSYGHLNWDDLLWVMRVACLLPIESCSCYAPIPYLLAELYDTFPMLVIPCFTKEKK